MDDEIKFNGPAHAGCEDEPARETGAAGTAAAGASAEGESGAAAVGEAETDNDAAATERETTLRDPVGPGDDGNQPEPQDVARGGEGGDEPGDGPSVEALVAEAERRGYLRGRNERIEALMAEPGVWEERESGPTILNRPHRSIWD